MIVGIILYLISPIPLCILMLVFLPKYKKLIKENESLRAQLKKNTVEESLRTPVLYPSEQPEKAPEVCVSAAPRLPAEGTSAAVSVQRKFQTAAKSPVKKQASPLNSTAVLFFIGVFLVSVGITVFAASTWKYQGLTAKSLFLAALSGISFVSAWISDKKLKLKQTSITAFSLGFVFLEGILFLAANANAFGGLLAMNGRGLMLLLCLVFLLIIIYGTAVRRMYQYAWSKWVAIGAYQFFLLFFVRFLDFGQTVFPFLFLTGISSVFMFLREQGSRPIEVFTKLTASGTSAVGFIISFISICAVSNGYTYFLFFKCLTPSVVFSVSAAGIFLCWLFLSKKLPYAAVTLPFSFLAFACTFQNTYIAFTGLGIMTAAGCKLVYDRREHFSLFRRSFLFTGPVLSALFILLIPGKIWMLAFTVFCIFLILTVYGYSDRNPVILSSAFVALTAFVFFLLWSLRGKQETWMFWAAVAFCGISAIVLLLLEKNKAVREFRLPAAVAMLLGMALAFVSPDPEFTPLSLIAAAILVCAAYSSRFQMLLALPLAKILIQIIDKAAFLPETAFSDSYAVTGIILAVTAALSLLPDKKKGFLGMNCFVPTALAITVYGAVTLPWQTWKASAVTLALAVISASQIRKDRKTKFVTVPLTIVLTLFAVYLQPFIDVPLFLNCKLLAAIPLLTVFACGLIFGKFRFYDTGLCIGFIIIMSAAVLEIIVKQWGAEDPAGNVLTEILIDKALLLGFSVMAVFRSKKHGMLWYYTGYAFFILLGFTHLSGGQRSVSLIIHYILAMVLSFIPDNSRSDNIPMFSAAAFLAAMMISVCDGKADLSIGLLLASFAVLSFLRSGNKRFRNAVIGTGSALMMLSIYAQPFFRWPDILSRKLLFIMPAAVFGILKKVSQENPEQTKKGAFDIPLCISLIILLAALCLEAIILKNLPDTFIAVGFGILLTMSGAKQKNRLLLYGGAAGVIISVLYATRSFWTSLPWWVYLIAAGAAAITFAVKSELMKRK